MREHTFSRRSIAEGLGTALLLAAVVGSGIMGERLAGGNVAVALLAITVMEEIGIELTGHRSKVVDDLLGQPWDYAITVCDSAKERCPAFPERTRRVHFGVEDPAAVEGTEDEKLNAFRWARNQLSEWIREWLEDQEQPSRLNTRLVQIAAVVVLIGIATGIAWWNVGAMMAAVVGAAGLTGVMTWVLWR